MPNDDKKEGQNTGVSDCIKKIFNENSYQEFLKKYLIKNLKFLIKNPKNGALSRNLIKNLKPTNKASSRVY